MYDEFKCQPNFWWLTGEGNDPKKTNNFLENKVIELEEQVQQLEKISSEKDTLIEKYKIEYKEGEHFYQYNEKCYYL